jgi:serine/threonine protein kinase
VNDALEAVLCDLGLAKVDEGNPSKLTTSTAPLGTLRYLSPEIINADVAQRTLKSDIWAWGCLLLEVGSSRRIAANC